MGTDIKTRIILDIFILFSIAVFPWWFSLILIIVGIFKFNDFYEAFVFGIIMDSFFGVQRKFFMNFECISFLFVLISFFFVTQIKKRLRIY
ncbi:hypothetical protein KKG48_00775 [Patescibacteria group bacterium]|nr:hypothetical protein [Patescibacteria group bacterium]MCG2694648.1 hypothetical protein [Candidatus Parcubacteria bacterium]